MALTAYPTILFNTATGSDTVASGAGPATAVTCDVETATTTPGSTSLRVHGVGGGAMGDVAQDGSHVIFITGIGFNRISTVTDEGGGVYTIVMERAISVPLSTVCAIGGKRATLEHADSRFLFAGSVADTGPLGASGLWTIQLEDDQTITSAIARTFTAGTGHLTLKGDSTSSRRTILQTGNAYHFDTSAVNSMTFSNLIFRNSNVTKKEVINTNKASNTIVTNCICGASDGTNVPKGLHLRSGDAPVLSVRDSAVLKCTGTGISEYSFVTIYRSIFSCCVGGGINVSGGALYLFDSIISYNDSDGAKTASGVTHSISGCTFHNNTGDGLEMTANTLGLLSVITNNVFTNNGGYGLNLSGTTPHYPICEGNAFGSGSSINTLGTANGITLSSTNITTFDPAWTTTDATNTNFKLPPTCKGTGVVIGAGQSGTTSYLDAGAAQRQEPVPGSNLIDFSGGLDG